MGKQLVLNGARIGDNLKINPFRGNKKTICLNRTKYILSGHSNDVGVHHKGFCLSLPSLKGDHLDVELKYVKIQDPCTQNNHQVYQLKSLNSPFRINGVVSFMSYLGRGDELDVGPNRLTVEGPNHDSELSEISLDQKILESSLNILIEGETGTGKSRLAKIIHDKSKRVGEFVHINISSYSQTLAESEIFGHSKGAFTGAIKEKRGALELANHGTLFIDEVDSLSIELQTKLLLFLDQQKYRRVGEGKERQLDVRLIFASGKNLRSCVKEEKMRKDFYFRISSGFKVQLPTLQNSPESLKRFITNYESHYNISLGPALKQFYIKYNWPGNFRQLQYHLDKKRVVANSSYWEYDDIDDELIEKEAFGESCKGKTLQYIKANYAFQIYHKTQGNISLSCKILGITSATLKSLLNTYEKVFSQRECF